jgi:transposase
MKYKEYNINEKLFGKDYIIYDWQETDEKINIYVKSQSRTGNCSMCKQPSPAYHATYKRIIQIIPMNMKPTYVKVTAYKYDCINAECNQKVFMEELPFVLASQVRTTELTMLILAVSLFLSNEGASKVLGLIGVRVSNDTIKRIYSSVKIEDNRDIEAVGIDDVAIRKGQSYATAIYDLNDHHLIALLNGRDGNTLKEWLKNHRKINFVTRDRASAYASAINELLPDCVQVADRFHLLSNLIERLRDIFCSEIPNEMYIKDGQVLDSSVEKGNKLKVSPDSPLFNKYEYDNTMPIDINGTPISYDNKRRDLGGNQYKRYAENRKKNSR